MLLDKYNCIRIMSINTYSNNIDIIWHYYIISHFKLWTMISENNQLSQILRKTHWSIWLIGYHMIWYFSDHMPYQPSTHISPQAFDLWTWANMGVSGWYDMWYEKCHIIIYNYVNLIFISLHMWPYFTVPLEGHMRKVWPYILNLT